MIELRDATASDDAARDALHREAFGFAPQPGMWAWKYRANPHGAAIERVVVEGSTIVAAFALVPRRFRRGSTELLAFQAADAMTAEAARRRGHYARLLESCEREAEARGGAFLFAFGGARSNQSFARAGWAIARSTREVRASLRGAQAYFTGRARSAAPFERLQDDEPLEPGELSDLAAGVRDRAWLAWRLASPRYTRWRGASGALAIVEASGARAVISDLWPPSAWQEDAALWRSLCAALRVQGASSIEMTLIEGEALAALAHRAGLRARARARARPLWVKHLREQTCAAWLAPEALWLRDLDRDAEGLLMREDRAADHSA